MSDKTCEQQLGGTQDTIHRENRAVGGWSGGK